MSKALTHFYWYGYAVTLFIGADKMGLETSNDLVACLVVAFSSWGGVLFQLLFGTA